MKMYFMSGVVRLFLQTKAFLTCPSLSCIFMGDALAQKRNKWSNHLAKSIYSKTFVLMNENVF
jgi:hypothetical protein